MKIFIAAPFGNYIKTSNTISVTGSWTIEKRKGRIKQILKTLRYTKRGWVNKIGLRNPGFDYGIKNHKENLIKCPKCKSYYQTQTPKNIKNSNNQLSSNSTTKFQCLQCGTIYT